MYIQFYLPICHSHIYTIIHTYIILTYNLQKFTNNTELFLHKGRREEPKVKNIQAFIWQMMHCSKSRRVGWEENEATAPYPHKIWFKYHDRTKLKNYSFTWIILISLTFLKISMSLYNGW